MPSATRSAVAANAIGRGRRMIRCASLYQPPPSCATGPAAPDRERVDARAEQAEERGQQRERDRAGERPDERAGDPHRAQEPEREDGERGDRGADGDRAECHGPAGGAQRLANGIGARATPRELLAETRDQQQAVVDPEPEACAGDDVERVRRHRGEAIEHAKEQQRPEDREPAADEGQERRDHAPEDHEREQEEDWERDELGALQVLLHLVVDLDRRDRHAADGGAWHRVHAPVDALGCLAPAPLRDACPGVPGHDRLASVARSTGR